MSATVRSCFYNVCTIVPPFVVLFYWPLIFLTRCSTTVADIYYAFVFSFSYYFVGEPIKEIKQHLFESLSEVSSSSNGLRLLEIGPGTGSNFCYFPDKTRLTTIELNKILEHNVHDLKKKYPNIDLERSIIGNAEHMHEIEDNSMDVVVGTHVLCCIKDPLAALGEIYRVLSPGGRYYFLELAKYDQHASDWKRRLQKWYAPIWHTFTLGCKAGNQCVDTLLENAGFYSIDGHSIEIDELPLTHRLVYYGSAVKTNNSKANIQRKISRRG